MAAVHEDAERLQALARSLLSDRDLAQRLASAPVAAPLLHEAESWIREAKHTEQEQEEGEASINDADEIPDPTFWQARMYFLHHVIPFTGFGFMDNAIMILAGDFIDSRLGIAFGMSTMAAAAIGNTFSDVLGLWCSGFIETAAAALGLPDHGLTNRQVQTLKVRILKNTSMVVGITIGCILGMFPLVYPQELRLYPSRQALEAAAARQEDFLQLANI